jgi:hypothetical protein
MMLAFVLRKDGPQPPKYFQDEEEEEKMNVPQEHDKIHHEPGDIPAKSYIPSDPLFPQQGWIQWEWKQSHTGEQHPDDEKVSGDKDKE